MLYTCALNSVLSLSSKSNKENVEEKRKKERKKETAVQLTGGVFF